MRGAHLIMAEDGLKEDALDGPALIYRGPVSGKRLPLGGKTASVSRDESSSAEMSCGDRSLIKYWGKK